MVKKNVCPPHRGGSNTAPRPRQSGFTLMEVMIVVVIIGILAAFAYPAYQDSVRKSRRSDAKAILSDVAARLEQFYQSNKSYTDEVTLLGYTEVAAKTAASPESYYHLTITALPAGCVADNDCTAYTLTATAQSLGNQDEDTTCATMTLDHKGRKTPASGCW